MSFLMYVKHMGRGGKIISKSKIFKNDAKKLKLTPKMEHIKSFRRHKKKIVMISIIDYVSTFSAKNYKKLLNFT